MAGGWLGLMTDSEVPSGGELRDLAERHVDVLEALADAVEILARAGNADGSIFEFEDGGQVSAPGASFVIAGFQVPVGKRLILRRVMTTAPTGSGPLAIYASASSSVDGGSLRHVVAAPALASTDIVGGTVIRGGLTIIGVFRTVQAGTYTMRLEGVIEDDGPRTSHTL